MTYKELKQTIATNTKISEEIVEKVVDELFFTIKDNLRRRKRIHIPLFGTFLVKQKKGKVLNSNQIHFHPSQALKQEIKSHQIKEEKS